MNRLLAVSFIAPATLFAQNTTGLRGKVTDPQGTSVPDAQVQLFGRGSTPVARANTPDSGLYSFEGLASGTYLVEVRKEGFCTTTVSVQVNRGGMKELNVSLELAGVNQSVVVTAAGVAQLETEISKSTSVITNEELQNRDAVSMADMVRYTPGLQVGNEGGPGQFTFIQLRGMPAFGTSILVDGMRFRDAADVEGSAVYFLGSMNLVNVDRVEIMQGSGSSLYGTNAVGGVVNIVTPQGGGAPHGELQAEGGGLGQYRVRPTISGGAFHDRLKYTAGLLHLNITSGINGHDVVRSNGGQGFVTYDLTPRMSISNRVLGLDGFSLYDNSPTAAGIPAANIPASGVVPAIPLSQAGVNILVAGGTPNYENATFVPQTYDPIAAQRNSDWFLTDATVFKHAVTPRFNWEASYQTTHTNRIYEAMQGSPLTLNYLNYVGDVDTVNLFGTGRIASWLTLTGGYEFEYERLFNLNDDHQPGLSRNRNQTTVSQKSNAAYFASQASLLGGRLQISLSGRLQAFLVSPPDIVAQGAVSSYTGVSVNSPPRALVGDASIAYLIPKSNTKFRSHVGNSYRAPSLFERYGSGFYNDPATGALIFTPYGDPRLSPERYNSVDGGIDQYLFGNRVKVSATYYYIRIQNFIAFNTNGLINPITDPFGRAFGFLNGAGGTSRGVELSVEARPLQTLTMRASYTYANNNTDQDTQYLAFSGHWDHIPIRSHWSPRNNGRDVLILRLHFSMDRATWSPSTPPGALGSIHSRVSPTPG